MPQPPHHSAGDDGSLLTIAQHFHLTEAETRDVIETHIDILRNRDTFLEPSNGTEPTPFPRLRLGSAKIDRWQTNPFEAYVEVLREIDPRLLTPVEHENGIRRHPTFARYVSWWRAGHQAPPLSVFEALDGTRRLLTSSRRRTLTAQDAGVPLVLCWTSPFNAATGNPLKYGDVIRVALAQNGRGFSPDILAA